MGKYAAVLLFVGLFPSGLLAGSWTHRAGEGGSLKALLERVAEGDTIEVYGEVREGTITLAKPVVLLGRDGAVIDGEQEGHVLIITAHEVAIRAFTLRGTRISNMDDHAAISVREARRVTIAGNTIDRCFFAMHLNGAHEVLVEDNVVRGQGGEEDNTANGIHLWKCNKAVIRNNRVELHRDGIYFEFVTDSEITGNIVTHCDRYGLHFMFSHRNVYSGNTFMDNGAGVAVMYSRDIDMHDNRFASNRGASAYGLLLKDINDGGIKGNTFTDNTTGILVDGCNRLVFEDNLFRMNGWALRLYANAMYCDFRRNVFSGNTFDVGTNGSLMYNTMDGNYWDRYTGYDLDRDGHGDVPHRPLGFFTLLVERMPHALVFSRSLFVSLLDRAERLIPSLGPEALKDDRPLMRPPGPWGSRTGGDPPSDEEEAPPKGRATAVLPSPLQLRAHG